MEKDLEVLLDSTEAVGECMEWTRCFNTDGYARAMIDGNANAKVHRVVFQLVNGYLPPVVRHSCDNIKCINPEHLVAGTASDNARDRCQRGRTHSHVPQEEVDTCFKLRCLGLKYIDIAIKLDITYKRVEYILTKKSPSVEG